MTKEKKTIQEESRKENLDIREHLRLEHESIVHWKR
jgi:hypothetical protein